MSSFIDVPLWDEPTIIHPDDPNMVRLPNDIFECRHCGDKVLGEYIWKISHTMCFNGWCNNHILCNNGANEIQLQWLNSHGFQVVDKFDEQYWDLP